MDDGCPWSCIVIDLLDVGKYSMVPIKQLNGHHLFRRFVHFLLFRLRCLVHLFRTSHDMETLYYNRIVLPIAHIYGFTGQLLKGADINNRIFSSVYLAGRIPIISALIGELENEFNTFIVEMKLENMVFKMKNDIHQVLLVLSCESAIGLLRKELSAKIKMMTLQLDYKQYLNVYVYERFGHKLKWYSGRIIDKFHQMKSETNAIKRQLKNLYDSVEYAVFEIKNSILHLLDLLCDQAKMELFELHDKLNEIHAEDGDGQTLTIHLILKINKIVDGAVNVYKQLQDGFSCNNMPRETIEFQRQVREQQELAREMQEFELAHNTLPTLNDVKQILRTKFLNPTDVEEIVATEKDIVKRAYEMPQLD
uniref:Uncharacterized protein n=1 Tax=Globodera rostochiensis TaxID=31243 RepID=A0A914HJU7_GLORO